mmetsp:Transcript_2969/g.4276  ORF Transcript_2969/g.4276 Transcript_2969/m.4276 type:complete len:152 (+) Transcript_2969:1616-2071(+)
MVLKPTIDHHAISIPWEHLEGGVFRIPISLHRVTLYFSTRKPTATEYNNSDLSNLIELMSEDVEWDPRTNRLQQQEEEMVDRSGKLRDKEDSLAQRISFASLFSVDAQDKTDFGHTLKQQVNIEAPGPRKIKSVRSSKRDVKVRPRLLAKN